jgi:hypothetical protein
VGSVPGGSADPPSAVPSEMPLQARSKSKQPLEIPLSEPSQKASLVPSALPLQAPSLSELPSAILSPSGDSQAPLSLSLSKPSATPLVHSQSLSPSKEPSSNSGDAVSESVLRTFIDAGSNRFSGRLSCCRVFDLDAHSHPLLPATSRHLGLVDHSKHGQISHAMTPFWNLSQLQATHKPLLEPSLMTTLSL